jgi:NodT family efflux transporter outer membrane factor (OMF) lipoprotein
MRGFAGVAAAARMAVACLSLPGCMVGPDYHKPDAPPSAGFKELAGWQIAQPADAIDRGAWWSVYNDPVLDGLERQIDISNQTLKEAEAAYRTARAIVDEARANLFPTLGVTASATRSGSGGSGSSGSFSTGTATGTTVSGSSGGRTINNYSLEASASWDLDVWGRIRRLVESDVAAAQASAADVAAARLSAQGSLATYYFELRGEDSLQTLLNRTVGEYTRALRITQNQYGVGVAARADVVAAQAVLESTESQAIAVAEVRGQYEHAIAVLTGHAPSELSIAATALPKDVPVIPPGLPSALLQRRPDVAAAERTMQQENALIGVAVAAFYPDISLSALYGYSGNPIGSLISVANRVWSLGASATETLFEGGARTAAVAAARATYDQFVATYRQTVLTAFQQVEDQLVALRVLERQAVVQDRAVASIQRAVEIALNEYRAGTVAYTTVITEQEMQLTDEQTAVTILQSRLVASVGLIQALGGGWDTSALPDKASLQTNNPLLP